ncbi:MAG: DUF58 domain-containing protein [Planctomycetes bacterium]|nr:DUF58 domain-containing protein [Planctomycetota bacterium]
MLGIVRPDPGAEARRPLLEPALAARVQRIRVRTHRLVTTALSGGYRSTFRGQGLEFSEVRAYQPGDDVRRIDWNVTARTGEPFVKSYAEERELSIELIVDTSRAMDFGTRLRTKRESAAQFSALISFVALRNQDRVGLLLYGDEPGLHLRARKGSSHVLRIVREVLAARPSPGAGGLARALEHTERTLRRRSVVFVVSDFLGASTWVDALRRLALRHDVIAVRVTDPLERELPRVGLVEFEEIGTGRRLEVDSDSASVREAWRARAAERRARIDRDLARARAEVIDLDAGGDLGEPVAAFFRRRAARKVGAR